VIRPKGTDLHYEVELALVIGREIKDLDAVDEKGAMDAIESMLPYTGYCPRVSQADDSRLRYGH
jgi:2-keto-4-pentenoate hydratase/2-oxohepta-3-ene-1,7-dioic acid hydratase in catechol pathway